MIVPIQIDFSGVSQEFDLDQQDLDGLKSYVIQELSVGLADQWQSQASLGLRQTRSEYIAGLKVFEEGRFKGGVQLVGWLPNAIESGLAAFDMKVGFYRSPKAKRKKDGGVYLVIPHRLAAPESLGESQVFTGRLPAPVHKAIREQEKLGIRGGLRASMIPEEYKTPRTRPKIVTESQTFQAYKNKFSIYEGITRKQQKGQSGYVSFRVVSENVTDASAWVHPGFQARDFAGKALEKLDIVMEVDRATDNYLANLGF